MDDGDDFGDDDFGTDAGLLEVLAGPRPVVAPLARVQQPIPQRIQQPTPQRIDRLPPTPGTTGGPKVVQPTPQVIGSRSSGSSILVSPRQKGNPILTNLRSFAWEYSDIPADYVLGLTTCALFLSLKYHRLHPEYIYNRIKSLAGKYNLRIILTMVDIENHEESIKELSKTSLVNDVTIILAWSAAEAARYLELYKGFEHANHNSIKGTESKNYGDKMVDFITVPRSINKTDAVSLVSAFGSVRAAVNASPEEIAVIGGWGAKKVERWCSAVDEPFRARKATRRGLESDGTTNYAAHNVLNQAMPVNRPTEGAQSSDMGDVKSAGSPRAESQNEKTGATQFSLWDPDDDDDEDALMAAAAIDDEERRTSNDSKPAEAVKKEPLSVGVAAALAKLRQSN